MQPKQEHKPSQVQGTEVEFAEITAGLQMTMLLKMASSFNLAVMEFSEDIIVDSPPNKTNVTVRVKTDARGIGEVQFITDIFPPSIWKLGGMYAVRMSEDREVAGLEPLDFLWALNLAVLTHRAQVSA